jgi:flagellar hook assembly protein FlgD
MAPGTHKIRVRAWDTYNNYSNAETVFDIETSVGLRLFNVYNYPNPFRSSTYFTFEHNQLSPLDVEIKIYTVAGRCIQTLKQSGITERPVKVLWDGLDRDGDPLANGVYLYKVIVKTVDGRFTDEELGKLSILR